MKDLFTQKTTAIPSCLTETVEVSLGNALVVTSESASESPILSSEGYRRVRRSAAMIGLAISMSATGMLLPSKNQAALAVESAPSETTITNLPSRTPVAQESSQAPVIKKVKLANSAIRHEVQQGESLWQLAEEYQIAPGAIAASNKISPQTELIVGQTLKIPSSGHQESSKQPVASVASSDSPSLKTNLSHLQQTRQQLQESLSQLKSEKTKLKTELATVTTEVADVSQSAQTSSSRATARITALSTDVQGFQSVEIPVPAPENELVSPNTPNNRDLRRPIPVAIPTPATREIRQASIPLNSPTPIVSPLPQATSLPLSKKEDTNGKSALSALETIPKLTPTGPNSGEFNRPIPIPVPSPETASISSKQQREINANPIQPSYPQATQAVSPLESSQPRIVNPTTSPVYQIKPGDTLNTIARRYGLSVSELIRANGLGNPNLIKVHQSIVIPQKSSAQKTRQNPTVVSALPLPSSRLNSTQSQLPAPSVVAPTPIKNLEADNPSQNLAQSNLAAPRGNTPVVALEIPVESPSETYTEKLKADFTNQTSTYPNRSAAIPIPVQLPASDNNSTGVVVGETINPEWSRDNQETGNQASESATSSVPRGFVSRDSRSQSQLVGTAPTDAQEYNNLINIPVGENVGPELPPLSAPDFPGSQMHFTGYIWPAKGVLTSGFGRRWGRMHKGIDIASPIGTPVMAAASGEVITAGWNSGGYGNLVKIQHPDGSITVYGHNSRILVRRGQVVQQGEQISEMGSTGYSTGPHLHFEVHPNGRAAENPIAYLPGVPKKRF